MKNMAVYMRDRRKKRRDMLVTLAGSACKECGSTDNLEFNHRDRLTKTLKLSGKGLDGKWETLIEELSLCDLLCKECHLEYTRKQYSTGEIPIWNDKKNIPHEHGTVRTYIESACRCKECKHAKSLYRLNQIDYWTKVTSD